jgi:hypothetical protein
MLLLHAALPTPSLYPFPLAADSACGAVTTPAGDGASIAADAVAALVAELKPEEVKAAARGGLFPVKFDTLEAEVWARVWARGLCFDCCCTGGWWQTQRGRG